MIYVLTKPETILEKIRFRLFGSLPAVECDLPRFGPAGVEATKGDSCRIIPGYRVMEVVFDGGYTQALATVRKEISDNTSAQLKELVQTEPEHPRGVAGYQ